MKIFHISDLHIGLKLFNKDLYEDQKHILNQIIIACKSYNPDVLLVAGDVYDKAVPSAEAVEMFNTFISDLVANCTDMHIMIISGNHDSGTRMDLYRNILSKQHIHMIGIPPQTQSEYIEKITLNDNFGDINFYLLPFVKPSMVKSIVGTDEIGNNLSYNSTIHKLIEREYIDISIRNILLSHQFYLPVGTSSSDIERMDSEICTVGNIDEVKADVLSLFDYAALGHIHKPMKLGSEYYRYSGTPLACSVSEAGQDKGIIMVDIMEKGNITTEVIPLVPLREIKVIKGNLDYVLTQGCDDYVSVNLTEEFDLDVIDMQDCIRHAFPNLLEIRCENHRHADYNYEIIPESELEPFELCCNFIKNIDEEEKELLRDVINSVNIGDE